MQFGLLYECQRPFKGTEIDWNKLYKETLAQCELADQVGFDNLWFVGVARDNPRAGVGAVVYAIFTRYSACRGATCMYGDAVFYGGG